MAGTPFEEFLSRQKSTAQKGAGSSPFEDFLNRRKAQDVEAEQPKIGAADAIETVTPWNRAALEILRGKSPDGIIPVKQIGKSDEASRQLLMSAMNGNHRQQDTQERSYAESAGITQPMGIQYGAAASAPDMEKPGAAAKVSAKETAAGAIGGFGKEQKPLTEAQAIQQMARDSERAYYDYIHSAEYKAAVEAKRQKAFDSGRSGGYAASTEMLPQNNGATPASVYAASAGITNRNEEDAALNEIINRAALLKNEADYWQDELTRTQDLESYSAWSDEDKALLQRYISGRIGSDETLFTDIWQLSPMGGLPGALFRGGQLISAEDAARKLAQKYGRETVDNMAETVKRHQNAQRAEEVAAGAQRHSEGFAGGAISSVGAIGASTMGSITGTAGVVSDLLTRTGRYKTLDPYQAGNLPNIYAGAVKENVSRQIAGEGEDSNIFRKGAALLYQGGMSAAENIARVAAGGKFGSLAMAASGSFASTVQSASEQGATPEQALALGIINAGVEAATEKIPLDELFKAAKTGDPVKALKQILKQGGIEAMEEEISLLATTFAEAAILRERSGYNRMIREQMAQGKTYKEARAYADIQLVNEAAQTAAVSFISGAGMEIGNQVMNYTGTKNAPGEGAQGIPEGNINPVVGNPQKQIQPQVEISKPAAEQGTPVAATQQGTGLELRAVDKPFVARGAEAQNETAVPQNPVSVTQIPASVTENVDPVPENTDRSTTNEHISLAEQMRRNNQMGGIVSETGLRLGEAFETPARGGGVSDGGIQWNGSQSTREQVGSVAEGAEQRRSAYADRSRATVARQNYARSLRIEKVSSLDLGLQNGTEARNIQVMPQENWDAEMSQLADRIYNETGKGVTYVIGRIQIRGAGGTVGYARGVITGDRIIVQADHLRIPMEQIADHEAYHAKVDFTDGRLNDEIRRHIVETFSEEQFRQVLDKYIAGLRGVIDVNETHTGAEFEAAVRQIEEEIFADAYAGINAFGAGADQFTGAVNEKMDQLYMGKIRNQDNGTEEPTGPPADRFSYGEQERLSHPTMEEEIPSGYEGRSLINDPEIYTYDFLVSQPDMYAVSLPGVAEVKRNDGKINPAEIAENGMKNALSVGTERDGKIYVTNRYTGRELWVTASSVRHGLNGDMNRILTNARLGAVIGDVVKNAIPVNALHNTADGVEGTYAMAGYATDDRGREFIAIVTVERRTNAVAGINAYDMTHALSGRQKRSKQVDTKSQGFSPSMLASEISIADLLDVVKSTYRSILSGDVLEKLGETKNTDGYYTGRVRYSYAGENANNADLDALARAKKMQAAGVADETIRQQTGWHIGMDGKWRWEIDDSAMQYHKDGDAMFSQMHPEYARHQELMKKFLYGELTEQEEQEFRELDETWGNENQRLRDRVRRGNAQLQNIIQHEELFDAYPQLRKTRLRFADLPEGTRGQYDPEQDVITLNESLRGKPQDTLIHEIQHAIQKAEGFSMGASTDFWEQVQKGERPVRANDRRVAEAERRIQEILDSLPPFVAGQFEFHRHLEKSDPDKAMELADHLSEGPYGDQFSDFFMLTWDLDMAAGEDNYIRGAGDLYRNTAGEIEARDAASRRQLTAEQRRSAAPARADDRTVFVERFSVEDDTYMEAVNSGDMKAAQKMVEAAAERWGAYRNNEEANEVFHQEGRIRTFYHGTNTGDFTTFDSGLLGSSSGDLGWFGKGFYFAFSRGEAETYGRRVIPAYLKMRNPYDYSQLYKFKGSDKGSDRYARFAWVYNITKQFPDIAEGQHVWAYPNDAEEGSAVSWKQLTTWMDQIQNKKQFSVEEVELNDGTTAWELRADPKKETFTTASGETFEWTEYGMTQIFATEQDAKEPINQIGAYLKNVMGVDSVPRRTIEKIDFSGALQRAGYDGILQSMSGDEAVVFSPEQIKTSEPVTYDDEGKVIPLSKRFSSRNPDIRYSVDDEDYDALESEFQAQQSRAKESFFRDRLGDEGYEKYKADRKSQADQKKRNTKVRDQVRRQVETNKRKLHVEAETAKINQEEQRRLRDEAKPTKAKRVLKDTMLNLFSIPAGSKAELGTMIDSYAERLIKNGSLTEEDRKAFFDRMYDAGVMTVPADEYFSEGRNLLKGGRVYVSDSVRKDFGDDWGDIRRRAFGAGIYLTSDRNAGGIDQWNHELAQELPGLFDSEETDDRSILERIVQLAEEGKDEKVSLAEYTARLADAEHIPEDEFLNNMERQMDWALRNFANAAGIEISTKEHAVRQQAATRKQNLKLQATLAAERQERKEKAQRDRDRQELRDLQQRTLKQLQWLNKNRNRAPEELKETWDEVLSDIDIYAVGAANEMQWSDKHSATWKDLAQMYKDAMKNDPNFLPSKELERIVTRLDATKIEDMDLGALQDLYKAAIGLRTEFYNRNNVINDEMQRLFAEVYTDSKNEIEAAPGGYLGNPADKFLNMDQLTPMNVLQRMAGWDPDSAFYSMAKQLERGERDMRAYSVKAQKMLQDFLTEHEDWVKKADGQGKDAIWYKVEIPELIALELGKKPRFGDTITVQMTPAQKVHMYLESKNVDNLRHMTGGRTFPDQKLYSEGKRQEAMAQGKTVRMAPDTVKAIVSDLTAEEMELARILEQYYNSFATQEINKVSNVLYGYDKAMGKNYAPIYTNKNYTKTEFGVFDTTAEGVGNLKGRQYAVNPSYNISCFDAFEKHVDQTARFVGMAIPTRNWTTLMNWREKNNSTADVITHKWGEEGKRYISDLITTLQGGDDHKTESVSSGVAKLQSNYISAIFGSNPSIVLKQLGSIPMGGAYLGMRNLPTPAQLSKIDRELISRYTSELDWRTMGYSTPETKQLKENPNWTQTNKFYRFAFGGGAITAMDGWAASTLWPWAENKVRNNYPDLEVGTQKQIANGESEFYKKVAEEFEIALARSQSTSDEIHQSTLRKSDNVWAKAFTMFRSDSAQTYNAIRQKIGEARYYARTGADKQTVKSANKAVGAAFGGLLLNAVWAEAITFLMALWKHKEDKYAEDDGELTVGSVAKEMTKGMLGSIAGVVTGGEELFEIIGNIVSGDEKWYGIDTPGLEQLNDLLDAVIDSGSGMRDIIAGAFDVVKKKGDLGVYLSRHSGDILGNIKTVAETVAMYFNGLPVSNVEAYLIGALKWISPELGAAYDDVFSDVRKSHLSGLHGNALASRIEDILADRKASNSDDTAQALAQLYEAGYKKAVPSDTPSTVTIDGVEHALGAYQKQAYEMIWGSIVSESLDDLTSSENFKGADQKTQEKMVSYLYTYAGEVAKAELFEGYEPNTRDEAIEAFSKVGLDMADFLYVYGKYSEIYNLDKSATLKAVEFAHWVQSEGYTAKQAEVIKEELAYYNMSPASSSRYDKMVDNGVDPDEAYDLTMEMAGLEPLEGETQIADVQRWRLAVDSSYVTATQFSMLKGMMSDKQFGNAQTANTFGVSPDAFVGYYEIRTKHDKDGNGAYNQAEVKAAIDSMGKYHLSTEEKAALWQIVTGTKSAKNNPYSVSVGERVLKYLSND